MEIQGMLVNLFRNLGVMGHAKPVLDSDRRYCVVVRLNGVDFGIDIRSAREIIPCGIFAEPRDKPVCVRAFFRHDGRMLPVLDIAARFGKQPLKQGKRSCLVVVSLERGKRKLDIGVMVDEARGLFEFGEDELSPVPEIAHEMMQVRMVAGMVKQGNGYLIMLDVGQLLLAQEQDELIAYMRQTWPQRV